MRDKVTRALQEASELLRVAHREAQGLQVQPELLRLSGMVRRAQEQVLNERRRQEAEQEELQKQGRLQKKR